MHTLQAIVTGAIQGLSEFLPISSSAHIVFSNSLYDLITGVKLVDGVAQEEIFFDIMVHLATLLAVIIYFFNDLKKIFKDTFVAFKTKNYKDENFKLFNFIALSTFITGFIGLLLKEKSEFLVSNPKVVCFLLIITGIVLLLSEKMYKGNKEISLKSSIMMSIAQGLAVLPGFSRSGFTIASGILSGLKRVEAAKFSFLMSIPVIILASMLYPMMEFDFSLISTFNIKAIAVGFLVSFIVGYLCIKYFMRMLAKTGLKFFGYYCITVAVIMFFVFQACHPS